MKFLLPDIRGALTALKPMHTHTYSCVTNRYGREEPGWEVKLPPSHGDSEGAQGTSNNVMEPSVQTLYLVPDPQQRWCELARNFFGDRVRL